MPTYEYVCRSCGHLFEIVQSMRDDPLTECPECGGELRKVFAPPAIAFKGSGFYATDHGKKRSTSDPASGTEQKEGVGSSETRKKDAAPGSAGADPKTSSSPSSTATTKDGGSS
jgi:putative FmdB family regulatory protein